MFQTLYKKCLDLASHKSSNFYLGLVSFIESSFFPIPPDVMIIPMVIAKKKAFMKIFLIASIFSVLGGILGYLIGYLFYDLAMYVIEFYNYENKVKNLKLSMSEGNGFMAWLSILFLAGFTPLPYKAFMNALYGKGVNPAKKSILNQAIKPFPSDILNFKFFTLFS